MNPESQPRLKPARLRGRKGVAIVTVLSIIALMTVLVVSLFNLAQSQMITAQGSVEIQRVNAVKDTAINLVIAQIREATTLEGTVWTSQPGAIRTFHHSNQNLNRLYKLYSASDALVKDIKPYQEDFSKTLSAQDLGVQWANQPDEWVNLNQPLRNTDPQHPDALEYTRFFFPIADPRSKAVGFKLSEGTMPGINKNENTPSLPMPMRWVYILRDGSTGTLQNGAFSSSTGGSPSPENPIVARVAWWADDESCKINANTASSPGYWSTPMTNSVEDHTFARSQPMFGEFQRFPGHPATVDIGAVLYPRKRWVPGRLRSTVLLGAGSEKWDYYSERDLATMWSIAPFVRENVKGEFGGMGGEWDNWTQVKVGLADTDDRLFATYDELYFKALRASQLDFTAPRDNLSRDSDTNYTMLHNLERGGFFLTVKSQSPEISLHSHPRLSMYPQHTDGIGPITQAYNGAATVSLPATVSPYDITVGVNTTVGRKAYYFQRRDSGSRHHEIGEGGDAQRLRNRHMWEYLKTMTQRPVPGYPEYSKAPKAFLSKYPAPAGAAEGSSDHWQIMCAMVDYARATNMNNDLLPAAQQYNANGHGQTTAMCTCYPASSFHYPHLGSVTVADQKDPSFSQVKVQQPKGYGRTAGANEIALVISKVWQKKKRTDTIPPDFNAYIVNANEIQQKTGSLYEVAIVGSAFSPAQGFHGLNPALALGVQQNGTGYNETIASGSSALRFMNGSGAWTGLTSPLPTGATYEHSLLKLTPTTPVRSELINWGGQIGPKAFFGGDSINGANTAPIRNGQNIALVSRFFASEVAGASLATNATVPLSTYNVIVYDSPSIGSGNSVQCFKLRLPDNVTIPIEDLTPHPVHPVLGKFAGAFAKPQKQPVFDPSFHRVYSYVVPHGDFRLTQGAMNVDADVLRPHEGNPLGPWTGGDPGVDIEGRPGKIGTHSMWEPVSSNSLNQSPTLSFARFGLVTMQTGGKASLDYPPGVPTYLPHAKAASLLDTQVYTPAPTNLINQSSSIPERAARFGYCRRDTVVFRGSCDPADTGDFDNGIANCPDGPYVNHPDDGDNRSSEPYYTRLYEPYRKSASTFSPNRMIPSSVMFGSIPTGVMMRVPWQTLRFRPDAGMNDDNVSNPPPGQPFSNYRVGGTLYPRDHHLMDYWWMPIVEPYSISEPFSTKGQINMNQELIPFGSYIERTTALYGVFQGERMMAIRADDVGEYKTASVNHQPAGGEANIQVRRFINPDIMAYQFLRRYQGYHADAHKDVVAPFNVFRSATEICELWMAPERGSVRGGIQEPADDDPQKYLQWIQGPVNGTERRADNSFWEAHKLTGDNARERPYAHIYPKLTTRSNVFRVHLVAQTLKKATSSPPETFDSTRPDNPDLITAEWRGHAIIDRTIDPREKDLESVDYFTNPVNAPRLDRYYTFRITELKQLTD